MPQANLGWHII